MKRDSSIGSSRSPTRWSKRVGTRIDARIGCASVSKYRRWNATAPLGLRGEQQQGRVPIDRPRIVGEGWCADLEPEERFGPSELPWSPIPAMIWTMHVLHERLALLA